MLGFAQIGLGKTATLAMDPTPNRKVIIGVAVDFFGFEALHEASFG
jgi:hypothetical protein